MLLNETNAAVRDFLLNNGISYEVKFRPTPQPDEKEGYKFQIHWYVFVGGEMFEYQTGIGFLPPSLKKLGDTKYQGEFNTLRKACETGVGGVSMSSWVHKAEYQPKAADVLQCMLLDASADNNTDFADWAEELGYSADSKTAEEIYNNCIRTHRKLKKIFTPQQRLELQDLLHDY